MHAVKLASIAEIPADKLTTKNMMTWMALRCDRCLIRICRQLAAQPAQTIANNTSKDDNHCLPMGMYILLPLGLILYSCTCEKKGPRKHLES